MSMKKRLTFQAYSSALTLSDMIGWTFPFVMVDSDLVGKPEENANTTGHVIRVYASGSLIVTWGFPGNVRGDTDSVESSNCMKILFEYGRRYVTKKLEEIGTLPVEDELRLTTYTEGLQIMDPERIPDPLDQSYEVQVKAQPLIFKSTEEQRRNYYLKHLYDISQGDSSLHWNGREIAGEIGIDEREADRIIEYLHNEGLLKVVGFGQLLKLTTRGCLYIENSGMLNAEKIAHLRFQSILFLRKVSEIDLKTNNRFVSLDTVATELGLVESTAKLLRQRLTDQGYLESRVMGAVSVTHTGKKFLEQETLTEADLVKTYKGFQARLVFQLLSEQTKAAGTEWIESAPLQMHLGFSREEMQSVLAILRSEGSIKQQGDKIAVTEIGTSREGALQAITRFGQAVVQGTQKEKTTMEFIPDEIKESLRKFQMDHPDATKAAFIMMRFSKSPAHQAIVQAIHHTLKARGIEALRADDKEYNDNLYDNIRTYIYGCGFGIAVFERLEQDEFNPNVSFEVGYMFGIRKPVCLLKERTLRSLHTDMIGKLYREFDAQEPSKTIPIELDKWLKDKEIVK